MRQFPLNLLIHQLHYQLCNGNSSTCTVYYFRWTWNYIKKSYQFIKNYFFITCTFLDVVHKSDQWFLWLIILVQSAMYQSFIDHKKFDSYVYPIFCKYFGIGFMIWSITLKKRIRQQLWKKRNKSFMYYLLSILEVETHYNGFKQSFIILTLY